MKFVYRVYFLSNLYLFLDCYEPIDLPTSGYNMITLFQLYELDKLNLRVGLDALPCIA